MKLSAMESNCIAVSLIDPLALKGVQELIHDEMRKLSHTCDDATQYVYDRFKCSATYGFVHRNPYIAYFNIELNGHPKALECITGEPTEESTFSIKVPSGEEKTASDNIARKVAEFNNELDRIIKSYKPTQKQKAYVTKWWKKEKARSRM